MKNKLENNYQISDIYEIIEESYYYYSYLESKNMNCLSIFPNSTVFALSIVNIYLSLNSLYLIIHLKNK